MSFNVHENYTHHRHDHYLPIFRTLLALGYQILTDSKQDQKRLKFIKLSNSYLQPNGYRPQPLDLSVISLNSKLEDLVEQIAENTHNVWAKERIKNGWTYGISEVYEKFCYLEIELVKKIIFF